MILQVCSFKKKLFGPFLYSERTKLVIIDSKLSFFQHTGSIKKKISRAIGIFYKIRNFVTKSILINLYYSLIYPFLIYAVHIWGGTSDNNLRPLHVLQKSC